MKKFKRLSVLSVLMSVLAFISCDTEPVDPVLLDNIGQEPGAGPAVFKVDFSGSTYVATASAASAANGAIAITGLKGTNGESVSITVPGTTVRSYSDAIMIYTTGGTSEFFYTNVNPANGNSSGNVSITSINTANKTISGTFSFVGYWADEEANLPNIPFTNGTFQNIPYTGDLGGNTPQGDVFFKAKVGGTLTTFSTIMPQIATDYLQINAINGVGGTNVETIGLTMPKNISAGTHPVADFPDDGVVANYSKGMDGYIAEEGVITITSNSDGWIKGTFFFSGSNFDGEPGPVITEGSFSVKY